MRIIRTHEDIEAGIAGLVLLDARLEHVVGKAGPVPLRRTDPGYRGLANIIVSQMVSKASAAAIWKRMESLLGEITADAVLALDDDDCRRLGLSRAKADTLRRTAAAAVAGEIDLHAICDVRAPAAIHELTAIKGIGRWTAEVYLLFCAGHPDVFPAGDVALQNAIGHALGFELRPTASEVDSLAAAWSPWRSVAARLFWAYYAQEMRRDALPVVP
ncbi:DNA-3-methyladenine glycosylase 2 family protein [Sinorhizobium medicae]|uniref:DNA-3-methyladenine glycosylase family protein n=1 Tax=Sinorhizobium medicae TaxID=110321 RepID=UPI000418F663|nr:DNA-3-methyladenine glycosylase [Sinorhizobium medicae]MBO1943272.1 DNA-3-methyladenine glycosylase 2 family protein [Sinorhizobium medicae]MDX0429110.1 DNA-3-methyladenine glycosylase 2 family protein [Sinorhizobium medicae]MDX0441909.1 DNA-3-methyladenine glycosylase 2 family protein [Sinorhizobium medicae]MDX0462725.1 DNA-3-methyladenine glycosylase 2 family protein [Sinorhizobium medicae]MDX0487898.1 DNA-3-methyladenine glycosylase 2 family protein [Sinorhizobium medicae]